MDRPKHSVTGRDLFPWICARKFCVLSHILAGSCFEFSICSCLCERGIQVCLGKPGILSPSRRGSKRRKATTKSVSRPSSRSSPRPELRTVPGFVRPRSTPRPGCGQAKLNLREIAFVRGENRYSLHQELQARPAQVVADALAEHSGDRLKT